MQSRNWIVLLVAAFTALAGCTDDGEDAQGGDGDGAGDGGTGDGGTGDGGTGGDGTGDGGTGTDGNETNGGGTDGNATEAEVTEVTLLDFPTSAAAGEEVVVCWHVEGSGNIPHTAVHWDNASHEGDDVTFQEYEGGLAWPDNATQPPAEGFDLPGDFCTALVAPEDADEIFFRAHAMISPPGMVSDEGSFTVEAA